nr:hypothetical protein [Tanacetum cinerariifolium]
MAQNIDFSGFDQIQTPKDECSIEVYEEKKQKMEDTILELVKIYRQKELLCMHDNVDDLIESALNSKLLSSNSQCLDKEEQEVKNVVEQPAECGTRINESLQNFRVIHKNSISLNNTSQISPNSKLFAIIRKRREVRLINVVKNDIPDDSSNDPLLEEADLFLAFDNSIPPGIENSVNNSEGDIRFLEALLIDDSIPFPNNESSESKDNPSVPRPPPEPLDFEPDSEEEILVVMNDKGEFDD